MAASLEASSPTGDVTALLSLGRLESDDVVEGPLAAPHLAVGQPAVEAFDLLEARDAFHHFGSDNVILVSISIGSSMPSRDHSIVVRPSISQQIPAHDQPHYLVGALENLVHAQIPQHPLDRMIAQIAIAAVDLQAAVDHGKAGVGGEPLGHGRQTRDGGLAPVERG